jgi:Uma2 family endonuclease
MAITDKPMTADDLWRLPDDGQRHELVAGELRTMAPTGGQHGRLISILTASLFNHVSAQHLGAVFSGDTGFVLARAPDTVRAPDVAYVRRERLIEVGDETSFWPGAPDLAIEVISPSDLFTEVEEKVADWLQSGARMVLAVNPRRRTVAVHRPHRDVRQMTIDDTLDGEDVVPGWTLPLRQLFADPLAG